MGVEENKKLIEKWIDEFNKRNFAIVDEIFTDDFVAHHSTGLVFNREQMKAAIEGLSTNIFPDTYRTIEDVIVTEDRAALFMTWIGTQKGEWRDSPPTNKKIKVRELYFLSFKNGKISENRAYGDPYGMLYQLGITPWWEEKID